MLCSPGAPKLQNPPLPGVICTHSHTHTHTHTDASLGNMQSEKYFPLTSAGGVGDRFLEGWNISE